MNYFIVTNNPMVYEEYKNVTFVEGSFEDLLIKVRDLVHTGYELISHPLGASIRMAYSPHRSVLLGPKNKDIDPFHIEVVESSITNYRKLLYERKPDLVNANHYSIIDLELLKSAIKMHQENTVL